MANHTIKTLDAAPAGGEPTILKRGSFFGHDPALEGLVPAGRELPAHLVLTLDNEDPRIAALGIDVGPRIRLVHPFHYSEGDAVSYRHLHGDAIEFIGDVGEGDPSWPPGNLPATLPARQVEIAPVAGRPEREFGECALTHIGDDVPTVQVYRVSGEEEGEYHDGTECAACSTVIARPFASVPSRPAPGLDIWDNDFVFALFWYCPACKAITTHNECD